MTTRYQHAQRAGRKVGVTALKARAIIDAFVEGLIEEVKAGAIVQIAGFGSLRMKKTGAVQVRNPQTRELMMRKERMSVKFRAAPTFVRRLTEEKLGSLERVGPGAAEPRSERTSP